MRSETKALYDREKMLVCKQAAHYHCECCQHPHEPATNHTLTAAHLDGNPGNNASYNLAALCQRCHLHLEGYNPFAGVTEDNYDYVLTHCERWFIPHLKGYIRNQTWGHHLGETKDVSPESGPSQAQWWLQPTFIEPSAMFSQVAGNKEDELMKKKKVGYLPPQGV